MKFLIWSSGSCFDLRSNLGSHFLGFLGRSCWSPGTLISPSVFQGCTHCGCWTTIMMGWWGNWWGGGSSKDMGGGEGGWFPWPPPAVIGLLCGCAGNGISRGLIPSLRLWDLVRKPGHIEEETIILESEETLHDFPGPFLSFNSLSNILNVFKGSLIIWRGWWEIKIRWKRNEGF